MPTAAKSQEKSDKKTKSASLLIKGDAYLMGDDIDCDSIIPVKYCVKPTNDILKSRCLVQFDADFPIKARKGVIIIAGRSFGRGSANENAIRALQLCGVKAVIAQSVASIFQRNGINNGLPVIECENCLNVIQKIGIVNGYKLILDLEKFELYSLDGKLTLPIPHLSELENEILKLGGLTNYFK